MSYRDLAWDWVQWAWRQRFGDKKLEIIELAAVCKMDKQRLYPMEAKTADASQDTLDKIAKGLGVPRPTKEVVLRFSGPPEKRRTALGWVREAGEAINQATGLLEREEAKRAAEANRLAAALAAKEQADDDQDDSPPKTG